MKKFFQVDDGCVLYLSDRKKSPTQWNDSSKLNNQSQINGATLARYGYDFDVNKTIEFLDNGIGALIEASNSVTVCAWVKCTGGDSIISKAYPYFSLLLNNSITPKFMLRINGNPETAVLSPDNITSDKFYHIGGTWDGNSLKIYVNGILKNTSVVGAFNVTLSTDNIFLGKNSYGGVYAGVISEPYIGTRVWPDSEFMNYFGKTRKFYGV